MKPGFFAQKLGYLDVTRALVVLGVLVGALDFVGAWRCPLGGVVGNVLRSLAQGLGVLQLVPVAGLHFLRSGETWARAPKLVWIVWLVVALPLLLLGGFVALACFG